MCDNKPNNDNFEMSDFSEDSETSLDQESIETLDKLELKYYPEPYNTIGQFILSSIVGASTVYVMKLRSNKVVEQSKLLDLYFDYCQNVKNDNYILELSKNVDNFKAILNKTKNVANKIIMQISDKIAYYVTIPDDIFSVESFNADIMKNVIQLIKFSDLKPIFENE